MQLNCSFVLTNMIAIKFINQKKNAINILHFQYIILYFLHSFLVYSNENNASCKYELNLMIRTDNVFGN